jgi:argonaute-like protein implicated in RNA metabolism and viral defense
MIAIRIENSNGLGPFQGKGYNNLPEELQNISYELWCAFPTPYGEFGELIKENQYCAFSSKQIFKNTVPQNVLEHHINEQNYKVYLLKLKNYVYRGKHQTVFEEKHIKEKIDITPFLGLDFEIKNSTFTIKI